MQPLTVHTLPRPSTEPAPTPAPPPHQPTPSASPSTRAFTGALGSVLIAGCDWAPDVPDCADLNVYGNGTDLTNMQCGGPDACTYGPEYQCTELAQRYAAHAWGTPDRWDGYGGDSGNAYQLWDAAAALPTPLQRFPNGGDVAPAPGDVIVFGQTADDAAGHAAVVRSVSDTGVIIVEQNADPSGTETVSRDGATLSWKLPVLGWVRPFPKAAAATAPDSRWFTHLR